MRQYPSIHEPQIAVSDGGHGSGRRCGRRNTVPSERIPWTLPPAPTRFFPLSSRRRARVKTDGFHTVSVDLRFSPSVRCTKRPMQAVFFRGQDGYRGSPAAAVIRRSCLLVLFPLGGNDCLDSPHGKLRSGGKLIAGVLRPITMNAEERHLKMGSALELAFY